MVSMLIVLLPLALAVRIADDACACHDDVWIACVDMLVAARPKDMAPAGAPYLGRYGPSWGAIYWKIWHQRRRHIGGYGQTKQGGLLLRTGVRSGQMRSCVVALSSAHIVA